MVKITSASWVEEEDPMFTGRFTISSNEQSKDKSTSSRSLRRLDKQPTQVSMSFKRVKTNK